MSLQPWRQRQEDCRPVCSTKKVGSWPKGLHGKILSQDTKAKKKATKQLSLFGDGPVNLAEALRTSFKTEAFKQAVLVSGGWDGS